MISMKIDGVTFVAEGHSVYRDGEKIATPGRFHHPRQFKRWLSFHLNLHTKTRVIE